MSLWKRGRRYWTDFTVDGTRYRKALRTANRNVAIERERDLVQAARRGRVSDREAGPRDLSAAVAAYLDAKRIRCSARTIELEEERLSIVKKHFGDIRLTAITAQRIAEFQRARHDAGIANRTINMDVGVLSRVLKSFGRWSALADHVRNLPERQRPLGRALTPEERKRLFDAASSNLEWEHVYCAAVVAANTSMRPVEVKHLRRRDVDLVKKLVHVRRSKNESSHRVIPLNAPAIDAIARMLDRADLLGHTEPDHFLWPACQWGRYDGTKPMLKWDTAWRALRDAAGLPGLRFHDLRHTVITELAELGVADHVLESISGHLSRRMLEHYSHIRIDAKRQALDALVEARRRDDGDGAGEDASREGKDERRNPASDLAEIPTVVTFRDATSQFTSQSAQSTLAGFPPSARLMIPLTSEPAVSRRASRTESGLSTGLSGETSHLSERVRSQRTKPLDPTRSERPVRPRASRTERDLAGCFSEEPSRASERVRGLGTKSPDQIRRDVRVVEGARLEIECSRAC
jgi:integrase